MSRIIANCYKTVPSKYKYLLYYRKHHWRNFVANDQVENKKYYPSKKKKKEKKRKPFYQKQKNQKQNNNKKQHQIPIQIHSHL